MRNIILALCAVALHCEAAFVPPAYTNRYESNGVTFAQLGGVKGSNFVVTAITPKQDVLVSGTNIKTINNQTLLGSGNITIQGGGGSDPNALTNLYVDGVSAKTGKVANISLSNYLMKTNAETIYQPRGYYVTSNSIGTVSTSGEFVVDRGDSNKTGFNGSYFFDWLHNKPYFLPWDQNWQSASANSKIPLVSDIPTEQIAAIGAHLNAEDARFVSTNYDSNVRLPEAYVEIKMSNNWITIWKEMTRWNKFSGSGFNWDTWGGFHAFKTNVTTELNAKAYRNWGMYDSETGGLSPEGYTQVSSSNILIAAGMSYQKTITSGGAVWVLRCNSGSAHINADTNGFFRITDSEGNTQFEIIKGDKHEVGADADGITVGTGALPVVTIPYSVEAGEHPTISVCDNLTTANWLTESDPDCIATVTWSGSSGAWVASVQRKTAGSALFVKASYMAGGETYIRNVAPVGMTSIMLNGTKYYLGTATISGHTVLTLSTTAP